MPLRSTAKVWERIMALKPCVRFKLFKLDMPVGAREIQQRVVFSSREMSLNPHLFRWSWHIWFYFYSNGSGPRRRRPNSTTYTYNRTQLWHNHYHIQNKINSSYIYGHLPEGPLTSLLPEIGSREIGRTFPPLPLEKQICLRPQHMTVSKPFSASA